MPLGGCLTNQARDIMQALAKCMNAIYRLQHTCGKLLQGVEMGEELRQKVGSW